jgi:hypothetical protein
MGLHQACLVILRTRESDANTGIRDTARNILEKLGVEISIVVFRAVTLCDIVGYQRLGGTYRLHFQGDRHEYNATSERHPSGILHRVVS